MQKINKPRITMPEPPMLAPAQATAIERESRKTARLHQLRATPTMKRAVPKVAKMKKIIQR